MGSRYTNDQTTIQLREMMENGELPTARIVGLSGNDRASVIDKCIKCGMDDCCKYVT
jgi:hypothetical protein